MKKWFHKNFRSIIIFAFVVPILTVAIVSISHVTKWYGISNPLSWSIYLSVGIEIAALSSIAAIAANMGKKVYFPFIIATIIQFIGNVFFSYMYINPASPEFISWVELSSPILSFMGVEPTDIMAHKRFLALFAGGMLPIISLSFLHMLVKFTEGEEQKKESATPLPIAENTQDLMAELTRMRPNDEELAKIESILSAMQKRKDEEERLGKETIDHIENNPKNEEIPETEEDQAQESPQNVQGNEEAILINEIEVPSNEYEINVTSEPGKALTDDETLENEKKKF